MTDEQAERLLTILSDIRDEFRKLTSPAEATECQHPEERRLDLSTMRIKEWRCRDCKYHHRVLRATGEALPV